MALVFMEKCADKFAGRFADRFAKPFTDKEKMALFWLAAFLTLGAALKAHQVHAKRWGEAFMAPPPMESVMRVGIAGVAAGDSLLKSDSSAGGSAGGAVHPHEAVHSQEAAVTEPVHVAPTPAKKAGSLVSPCPITLNAATAVQLQNLPGVGEKTAERILAHRQKFGPFRKVDDLLGVKGIGQKKLDRMRGCLIL